MVVVVWTEARKAVMILIWKRKSSSSNLKFESEISVALKARRTF